MKDCLVKTRHELVLARKPSNLRSIKIDFAKKTMSNTMSNLSLDLEEELVNLYSTLVDEDNFEMEDDQILSEKDFLQKIKEKLTISETYLLNWSALMRSRTRSWKESSKRKLAGSMVGGTVLAQLEVLEAIEEILNWLVVTPVE